MVYIAVITVAELYGVYCGDKRGGSVWCTFTFTFSHLADAFVQSDVQGREYSSYEQ